GIDVMSLQIGTCVRTRFAGIAVVMLVREQHAFDLLVDRSYARYLAAWLERAAGDPLGAA
ncbi:MAG TPA: hypothetical protein VLT59_07175, partial [Steroidobacteraceae bacterium]|nr:hypothetical protein [Steroidobacteraceae bacterium]